MTQESEKENMLRWMNFFHCFPLQAFSNLEAAQVGKHKQNVGAQNFWQACETGEIEIEVQD